MPAVKFDHVNEVVRALTSFLVDLIFSESRTGRLPPFISSTFSLVSSPNSMDPSAAIQATNTKVEDEKARHSKRFKIKQLNSIPLGAWR